MRFAYIDSQGNEVPIPSVDALALRIELGAVGPDTQLYDAQADHWGPARTHEIFHTLSRDVEDEGFVPPPVAPPTAGTTSAPSAGPEQVAEPEVHEEPEPEPDELDESPPEGDDPTDFGLTLADPLPTPSKRAKSDDDPGKALGDLAMEEAAGGGDPDDLPLLPGTEPEVLEPEAGPSSAEEPLSVAPSDEADDGGFDFGDLGAGLELEDASDTTPEEPMVADFGGGMDLETEREFESPSADFDSSGDELQLEQPMSAFEPDAPPGWMEEGDTDDVMDFSAVTSEEDEVEEPVAPIADVPTRQRRTPKDRPSPPKFKRQRSMSGPIFFVVLLMAVGVGGYYGWPIVQQQLAERSAPERPPVVMPPLAEDLVPQMRSLGNAAIAAVVATVAEQTADPGTPTEPHDDWLAGVYLGNASQYAGVEAFWLGMESFVDGLRSGEWQAYHDAYMEEVEEAGLEESAAAQITERADSGFVAAQPLRLAAYAEMERLVDAALDLHEFLLENEADIVFRPGVTSATDETVDPVLEIAAPDEDTARMLEMFDEITEALDAFGSLDRVTRDRLVAAMTSRLQQVGLE